LARYPYLISPELKRPIRQKWVSGQSRTDLMFETGQLTIIVEIKRGKITAGAVDQLLRYRMDLKIGRDRFRGILIGRGISAAAEQRIERSTISLRYLGIGKEIPEHLVFCWKCRKARAHHMIKCPYDGSTRLL